MTTTPSPKSTSSSSRYGASFAGTSAIEERGDRRADGCDVFLGHPREDRQREELVRERLGDRERAAAQTEVLVCAREVRRLRIVAAGADPALAQEVRELRHVRSPDGIEVPDR